MLWNNGQNVSECLQNGRTARSDAAEVKIADSVSLHFQDIGHDPKDHSVTYENAQARERTQVLMDIANATNGMVIGTGDMSELALGWATYNGDHMSMYGVNASVPKTLVRHLVKYAADVTADPKLQEVLYDVLDTPVSLNCFLQKTGISHKRLRIWWDHMSCMIFICISCCGSDMSRVRSIGLQCRHLKGYMRKKQF